MKEASSRLFPWDRGEVASPGKPVRVIGIDLGTTNSTAAELVWDPQAGEMPEARCLELPQETTEGPYTHTLVPSVVTLYRGRMYVGEGAKRMRTRCQDLGLEQNRDLFYECKNEMGVERTYHKAPQGFRSAAEIAGHVLAYLSKAATDAGGLPVARTVVTVPASFQAAQRSDTLKAAWMAGIQVTAGDLLDEPVAAFLDYLVDHHKELTPVLSEPRNLLVFDFGGGTCDVAVLGVGMPGDQGIMSVRPLSVSRYHRLGGGDIDRAIVYEVLLPQLLQQNGLGEREFGYEDKKRWIEPALLGIAETLKVGLSINIDRQMKFGKYDSARKSIQHKVSGQHPVRVANRHLTLTAPVLTAEQFESLLKPFLDTDLLYARETEYRLTNSIFAPLQDGLDRAGLEPEQVDLCLLVGGSSLIPQVVAAVKEYLPASRVLTFPDRETAQTAVARGAAYHALSLAIAGRGLIQPVASDCIAIKTEEGSCELIPRGALLPYPSEHQFHECTVLSAPVSSKSKPVSLKVQVVAGEEERPVLTRIWEIPPPVTRGQSLVLQCRLDANQVLELHMHLAGKPEQGEFSSEAVNPLTNVVNPEVKRLEIDRLEEDLRIGVIPRVQAPATLVHLADLYSKIGQREKAIDYLKIALRATGRADAGILNQMAGLYAELGDMPRAEHLYREAAAAQPEWGGPLFNLALYRHQHGDESAALADVEDALSRELRFAYLVLQALICGSLKDAGRCGTLLRKAIAMAGPLHTLDEWELYWLTTAAKEAGDQKLLKSARAEQRKRLQGEILPPADQLEGLLPLGPGTAEKRPQ